MRPLILPAVLAVFLASCASVGKTQELVQPPRFAQDPERPSEVVLRGISADAPAGGATIFLWTRVTNPNPFGFTLSTVRTTLSLGGVRAATGNFPLGLPLPAGESSAVPFELTISFTELPALAQVVRSEATGGTLKYQLDGTIGVDAGPMGTPVFGPLRLVSGDLRARR